MHLDWTWINFSLYTLLAFVAGITASMVGSAAPLLIIMFALRLRPEVIVATDSLMHLFNSFGITTGYITAGEMSDWPYMSIVYATALVGTALGALLVVWVTRRGVSTQLATLAVLFVMQVIAAALLVTFGTFEIISDAKTGKHLAWNMGVCKAV